jgi:DNA-directed RNA polymerase subunit beta
LCQAGEKITARRARDLGENGLKEDLGCAEELVGKYLAKTSSNMETGRDLSVKPATSSKKNSWTA